MKHTIIYLSIIVASGLLLTNIYTSIVDARSWGSDIPRSIETARAYYAHANPGDFFRIFSPLNQLLALVAIIVWWRKSPPSRKLLIGALVAYGAAEAMTFNYFYPRNALMFTGQMPDADTLRNIWQQWNSMNWVRTIIVAAGICCTAVAMHKVGSRQ